MKSWSSFLLKTYRRNCIENDNWSKAPRNGWHIPSNWFVKYGDLCRTRFVVKYLDGIDFLLDKLEALAEQTGFVFTKYAEAREEGYFAYHTYFGKEFEIPGIGLRSQKLKLRFEVQITTQLQENIGQLLHKYYEQRRDKPAKSEVAWQWRYESEEFVVNYLGHILHYLEGMIMEARKRNDKS